MAIVLVAPPTPVVLLVVLLGLVTLFFLPSSILMTQSDPARDPARFCQTPMWELSLSSRRQVREGEGSLQHFRSLMLSSSESALGHNGASSLLLWSWPWLQSWFRSDGCILLLLLPLLFVPGGGKLVLAFWPFISMAAWSYALAAASAVSNVPSHTLLFLYNNRTYLCIR